MKISLLIVPARAGLATVAFAFLQFCRVTESTLPEGVKNDNARGVNWRWTEGEPGLFRI
jgi:hypothetical protein